MKQIAIIFSVIGIIAGTAGVVLSFGKDSLLAAICASGVVLSVISLMINFNSD